MARALPPHSDGRRAVKNLLLLVVDCARADKTVAELPGKTIYNDITKAALAKEPSFESQLKHGLNYWVERLDRSYRTGITERYGLVWSCLGDPVAGIPDIAQEDDPSFRRINNPVEAWATSATRMTDNFLDIAHFPWVHTAPSGGGSRRWSRGSSSRSSTSASSATATRSRSTTPTTPPSPADRRQGSSRAR